MARVYSLPTMLRLCPGELLADLADELKLPDVFDVRNLGIRAIGTSLERLARLAAEDRDRLEAVLRDVFDLASEPGGLLLREAAERLGDMEYANTVPEGNAYAHALWSWLRHPEVFATAVQYHELDAMAFWRQRAETPRRAPDTDDDALRRLGDLVSDLLLAKEGRGRRCNLEATHRGSVTYVFAHADDHPEEIGQHDEAGGFGFRTLRRTFQIVFAHDRDSGLLDLHCRGNAATKSALQQAFVGTLLASHLPKDKPPRRFELNRLKAFPPLATDPLDGVKASLKRLRLDFRGTGEQVHLATDPNLGTARLYWMMRELLDQRHAAPGLYDIGAATMTFEFGSIRGRRAASTVTLAQPDHSDLRAHRPERVRVIEKYLRRWGLYTDAPQ